MADQHAGAHHATGLGEPGAGRTQALGLGVVMLAAGVGVGVTTDLLPVAVSLGASGLLVFLWGAFYSTPAVAPAIDSGHGHAHGAGQAAH